MLQDGTVQVGNTAPSKRHCGVICALGLNAQDNQCCTCSREDLVHLLMGSTYEGIRRRSSDSVTYGSSTIEQRALPYSTHEYF